MSIRLIKALVRALLCGCLLTASGCSFFNTVHPQPVIVVQPGTTGTTGTTGGGVQVQAPAPAAVPSADTGVAVADSAIRAINIGLDVEAGNAGGRAVAADVKAAVAGALARQGYTMDATWPYIVVDLDVRAEEFDRIGSQYVFRGDVRAALMLVERAKELGSETITARGARALGADEARKNLAQTLGAQTAAWVSNACTGATAGLVCADVTITARSHGRVEDPAFARQVIDAVNAFDGVLSCVLLSQNVSNRQLTFRIVHVAARMPEGIVNRLANDPTLKIRVGK